MELRTHDMSLALLVCNQLAESARYLYHRDAFTLSNMLSKAEAPEHMQFIRCFGFLLCFFRLKLHPEALCFSRSQHGQSIMLRCAGHCVVICRCRLKGKITVATIGSRGNPEAQVRQRIPIPAQMGLYAL